MSVLSYFSSALTVFSVCFLFFWVPNWILGQTGQSGQNGQTEKVGKTDKADKTNTNQKYTHLMNSSFLNFKFIIFVIHSVWPTMSNVGLFIFNFVNIKIRWAQLEAAGAGETSPSKHSVIWSPSHFFQNITPVPAAPPNNKVASELYYHTSIPSWDSNSVKVSRNKP